MSGAASFYAGLIENKDKEIKRLTQIVSDWSYPLSQHRFIGTESYGESEKHTGEQV